MPKSLYVCFICHLEVYFSNAVPFLSGCPVWTCIQLCWGKKCTFKMDSLITFENLAKQKLQCIVLCPPTTLEDWIETSFCTRALSFSAKVKMQASAVKQVFSYSTLLYQRNLMTGTGFFPEKTDFWVPKKSFGWWLFWIICLGSTDI